MEYALWTGAVALAFSAGLLVGAAALYMYFIDELDGHDVHQRIPPYYPGH